MLILLAIKKFFAKKFVKYAFLQCLRRQLRMPQCHP